MKKNKDITRRNIEVCAYYKDGHSITDTGKKFGLSKQHVMGIIKREGVWKPYKKKKQQKTSFLGMLMPNDMFKALKARARLRKITVSKFVREILTVVLDQG